MLKVFFSNHASFNPCYAGSKIERIEIDENETIHIGFNPCYAGSKIERRTFAEPETLHK